MTLRYFGTDGVRGRAFEAPLTLEDADRWGRAWAHVARTRGIRELVLGWDPRLSSEDLAAAFLHGWGELPACVLGLVPTPAVAWATARREGAWGLMVSASHNPPGDNGIKGFDGRGEKLSEADEQAIEAAFEALAARPAGRASLAVDAAPTEAYLAHLEGIDLPEGLRLVVDCAHGAAAPWAGRLLRGAGISWLGCPADGARINVGVGSTHLEALQARVRAEGAFAGVAFDGDSDRCLFVDGEGALVDGDQLLWLLARDLREQGHPVPGVVGTLMSNAGLEEALRGADIPFVRTPVGDKFMLRELGRRGWDLAAEASGHVIQKHVGPSGDGLATALAVLRALLRREASERWSWRFPSWPLRLVNVKARERRPLEACAALRDAQAELEATHGGALRIVVRWSGTEPKLRLMVEAREARLVDAALEGLEAAARRDLGL